MTWKLRLLGGAIGALTGVALLAILILVLFAHLLEGVLGFVQLVNLAVVGTVPGMLVGFATAPRIVAVDRPERWAIASGVAATLVGAGGVCLYTVLAGGSSLLDVVRWPVLLLEFMLVGIFGSPVALASAFVAAWTLRRLASKTDALWIPCAALVAIVVTLAAWALTQAALLATVVQAGPD